MHLSRFYSCPRIICTLYGECRALHQTDIIDRFKMIIRRTYIPRALFSTSRTASANGPVEINEKTPIKKNGCKSPAVDLEEETKAEKMAVICLANFQFHGNGHNK